MLMLELLCFGVCAIGQAILISDRATQHKSSYHVPCTEDQSDCVEGKCVMLSQGVTLCTECKSGKVPINGACFGKDDGSSVDITICTQGNGDTGGKRCTACNGGSASEGDTYFLFYGGCYSKNDWPGSHICKTVSGGTCSVCETEYRYVFTSTEKDATEKCISCGDAIGITIGENDNAKTYKGVDGCKTCTLSGSATTATCTECGAGFLHTSSGSTSCVSKCPEGYFEHTDSNTQKKTCQSCSDKNAGLTPAATGVAGCAACTYDNTKVTCTKCKAGKYLKTAGDSTSCVTVFECVFGFFPKNDAENGNKCVPCGDKTDGIVDCKMCSKNLGVLKCSTCKSGKKPNTTGTACVACNIADCANCNEENVCEMCTSNKKLSPLKDACLTDCPAGTYDDNNVCKPCHVSCAECNSNANQDSCTACYPGSVLNKTDSSTAGTCIPECTGRYAENCEAGMCTANIGGSKYCSKCKSGFVPVDGLCVSATARVPTGCTSKGDGTCAFCTSTYFLQSGGCYNTQTLPGKAVCTAITASNNGQCQTCANGQNPTNGNCPACAEGCAKCQRSTSTCTECLAGYYKTFASKCVKCSETSGNIQGVKNCISCEKPSSGNGAVTCYVKTDKGPNLSIGAIAGISVAVIVVVGGLVGLLCWWFVCHGKA
ncbi:Variant-specific surface protein [Giardia duodenalis]|uniref:Variant-specific surface protein n=1 Tax=Giardia intestinalis TaxID=5741 RepID=V6TSL9_GIAIN|nr:Variant-specific surface protein [Giardia intestinalis]